jgi:hypothetical protein
VSREKQKALQAHLPRHRRLTLVTFAFTDICYPSAAILYSLDAEEARTGGAATYQKHKARIATGTAMAPLTTSDGLSVRRCGLR